MQFMNLKKNFDARHKKTQNRNIQKVLAYPIILAKGATKCKTIYGLENSHEYVKIKQRITLWFPY